MTLHEHDASCSFGNPTCPEFTEKRDIAPIQSTRHRCALGNAGSVPAGTLRQCESCGRWYRSVPTYVYWTESEWYPVRWWQWRLRRHIKRELAKR